MAAADADGEGEEMDPTHPSAKEEGFQPKERPLPGKGSPLDVCPRSAQEEPAVPQEVVAQCEAVARLEYDLFADADEDPRTPSLVTHEEPTSLVGEAGGQGSERFVTEEADIALGASNGRSLRGNPKNAPLFALPAQDDELGFLAGVGIQPGEKGRGGRVLERHMASRTGGCARR